jgi:hypothetical protein
LFKCIALRSCGRDLHRRIQAQQLSATLADSYPTVDGPQFATCHARSQRHLCGVKSLRLQQDKLRCRLSRLGVDFVKDRLYIEVSLLAAYPELRCDSAIREPGLSIFDSSGSALGSSGTSCLVYVFS